MGGEGIICFFVSWLPIPHVEPTLPSQHQLEMCLRRLKASAYHLAVAGQEGEGILCFWKQVHFLLWQRTNLWLALPPLPAPARDVLATPNSIGLPLSCGWTGRRGYSMFLETIFCFQKQKCVSVFAVTRLHFPVVSPRSLPSQHQLEMCLRCPKASACHLAVAGQGG